mgnify:CR=1 FL=1
MEEESRPPVLHRMWGALLVIFGLWLTLGVVMSTSFVSGLAIALGAGVCLSMIYSGYSLWTGSPNARVGAVALAACGLAGFVVAVVNGAPLSGLGGLALFGAVGGITFLLARGSTSTKMNSSPSDGQSP